MYLNKVYILGNLTRDPELKSLPSGIQVASFGMATNRVYKDKEGNRQEQTEFHNIVAFGRQGELCAQYLRKGSSALIDGRIQTRSWEQNGEKKYRTEIVADNVQFGDRKQGDGGSYQPKESGSAPVNTQALAATKHEAIEYPDEEINPDGGGEITERRDAKNRGERERTANQYP
jgi:single-strand DNA-binding protein